MAQATTDDSEKLDNLLGDVVAQYFDRLRRGERPTVGEYVERYPEIAELMKRALPALDAIKDSVGATSDAGRRFELSRQTILGDFRILHELGRGGMGIVYEAEQISLGRRVAVKILPLAALVDGRMLARFRNEVRAAATLDHPNIVAVHAVGEERGIHYYVMQLVRGQSLAELIAEVVRGSGPGAGAPRAASAGLTTPRTLGDDPPQGPAPLVGDVATAAETRPNAELSTSYHVDRERYFRRAAELVAQIASALAHAHEQGVVHRDVKPANILIDVSGKPLLTDFGLARIASDVGVTMTGDLVGTLRYMAPEQALGRQLGVDHRADVYALGATLYELLSLRPPFTGRDRETLLRQLAFEEPAPLRRHSLQIPATLEVITLKALAKVPADRYATAQELADDLQRFLEHQPIRAQRPSVAQRCRSWVRRHQRLATAAVGLLVMTTLGLATSTALIAQQRTQKDAALQRASENLQLAKDAVDRLTSVAAEDLVHRPQMEGLRFELLTSSLEFYEHLARQQGVSPEAQLEIARANQRLGTIYLALERRQEAYDALQAAVARLRPLHENQRDMETGQALAAALMHLARTGRALEFVAGRTAPATSPQQATAEAVAVLEQLAAQRPADRQVRTQLAEAHWLAGQWPSEDQQAKRQHYERSQALLAELVADEEATDEQRFQLAKTTTWMVNELGGDIPLQAIDMFQQVVERNPANAEYRKRWAQLLWNYAVAFGAGYEAESASWLAQSAATWEELVAEYPSQPGYREQLAMVQMNLANQLLALKESDLADSLLQRAEKTMEQLQQDYPQHLDYGAMLIRVRDNLSAVHFERADYRQLVETQLQIIEQEKLRTDDPAGAELAYWNLGCRYFKLANALAEQGEVAQPLQWAREGQAAWRRFRELHGGRNDHFAGEMASSYRQLYERLLAAGEPAASADLARAYVEILREEAASETPDPFKLLELAHAYVNAGYPAFRHPDEALRLADTAASLHDQEPRGIGFAAGAWRIRGLAYYRQRNWSQAKAAMLKSIELRTTADFPANGYEWFVLAMADCQLGELDEARRWYDRGAAWMHEPNNPDRERQERDFELRSLQTEAEQLLKAAAVP